MRSYSGDGLGYVLAPESDLSSPFLAVYDKTLVDEAKTYIESGGVDTIRAWRHFQTDERVEDAVAYGYGCWDTVSGFNNRVPLYCPAHWMSYYRPRFTTTTEEGIQYYVPLTSAPVVPSFSTYARYDNTDSQLFFLDENDETLDSEGGLLDETPPVNPYQNYSWRLAPISAGIDCCGLVCQCANYDGNRYLLLDDTQTDVNGIDLESWSIDDCDDSGDDGRRRFVVPGDILIRLGHHVAIVLEVEYQVGTRQLLGDKAAVRVIEAARAYNQWRVMDHRSWGQLESSDEFSLMRLERDE